MNKLVDHRADTPACESLIHLNNAGAALPPKQVTSAMQAYLAEEAMLGGYEMATKHAELLQQFYREVALLLGAKPEQIAWTNSATDAYVRALSAIPLRAGEVILTTVHDYLSNHIAFQQLVRHQGIVLHVVPDQPTGGVDMVLLRQALAKYHPRLLAVTHMPTNSGLIQDVYTIGKWCQGYPDCWFLVDACQTAGQLPLDVAAMQCDFLTATFRKFLRGPRGGGFLYVSQRVLDAGLEPRFMDLHSADWTANDEYLAKADARRFELWERNYAIVRGATVATHYARTVGLEYIAQRTAELAQHTRTALSTHKNIRVLDRGNPLGAIVACYILEQSPEMLLQKLRKVNVNTSVTYQDYAPLPLKRQNIPWILRLSPHYYNTIEEVELVTKEIFKIIC